MMNSNKNVFISGDKSLSLSLQMYAAFYPRFYLLESTLKNRLFNLLKRKLGEDWFTKQLNNPQIDPLFSQEQQYINMRKPKGFLLKDTGLLVESGMGFWVEFFNRRLYKVTKGLPISIFENLPKDIKRRDIYLKLDRVKNLRNFLFHSRIPAITKSADLKILDDIINIAKDLENLLEWLGNLPPDLTSSGEIIEKASLIRKHIKPS